MIERHLTIYSVVIVVGILSIILVFLLNKDK